MFNVAFYIDRTVSRNITSVTLSTFYQYYHIHKNEPTSTVYISKK